MEEFFRQRAEDAPRWNFIWMYEDRQQGKIPSGLWLTILTMATPLCTLLGI